MTEQELVEKVALSLYNRKRVKWKMRPVDYIGANKTPQCEECREEARAAISVIQEDEFTVVPSDIRRAFYYPIEMPVTADGHGPATVGVDAVKITYEVWDRLLNSHGSHDNLPDAINQAIALNSRAMIAASPIGEK